MKKVQGPRPGMSDVKDLERRGEACLDDRVIREEAENVECWRASEKRQEGMIHSFAHPFAPPGFRPILHSVVHATSMLHMLTARQVPSRGPFPRPLRAAESVCFGAEGTSTLAQQGLRCDGAVALKPIGRDLRIRISDKFPGDA